MLKEINNWDVLVDSLQLSDSDKDFQNFLKTELLAFYRLEKVNLIQKSKLNWIRLRDENTSFFHRFLAAKKGRNLIPKLVNN